MKRLEKEAKIRHFFMGLINNNAYVVILSASSFLTKKFKKEKYQSLYSGSLVLFSIII